MFLLVFISHDSHLKNTGVGNGILQQLIINIMQFLKKITLLLPVVVLILASCDGSQEPAPKVTANAGADQEITLGETVSLDGSASNTSDGKPLTYRWEIVKKPANSAVALSNTTDIKPSFVPDLVGEYQISLTVANGTLTHTDEVTITVKYLPLVLHSIATRTVLADRTTDPAVADYWVNDDIAVDAELVVMPGVVIAFAEDVAMWVNDQGILIAKGEAGNKITFTGKANGQGYWRGIIFYSGSNLNELLFTEVLNAGSMDMISNISAGVTVADRARVNIKNCKIAGSGGYGLNYMEGAVITGFANNTFSNNLEAPLTLTADHVARLDAASSFSNGNGRNVIEITGSTLTGSTEAVWPAFADNTPYRFTGHVTINTGWKISPGITIEVAPNAFFDIGDGYINAIGTTEKKIRITGVDKTASSWDGMVIYSRSNFNVMQHVQIEYAGNNALISGVKASITVTGGGSLLLKNSVISNSGGYGIFVNGGDVVVNADIQAANTFSNNASEPVLFEE